MSSAVPAQKSSGSSTGAPLPHIAEVALFCGVTLALLVPCLWQEHIQAGDLSSHVYNAWLASRIRAGAAPGLTLAHPLTNVLSDWLLEGLMRLAGAGCAERIVVTSAILLFFWGAFYLIHSATRRRPWLLAPSLAMLAYGLVFEFGFLNFYISTAICLWIVGLLWMPTRRRTWLALPLVALALLAHAMPVAWAAAVLGYLHLARKISPRMRLALMMGCFAGLVALQSIVFRFFSSRWSLQQSISLEGILGLIGTEQMWLSGGKYLIVAAGVTLVWCALFLERLDKRDLLSDPLTQIWILQLAAFVLLPSAIQLPQYHHVLAYIPQRLSLFNALILCALVGGSRHGRGIARFSALIATVFFTFLYLDARAFNQIEREVQALVETLPPGQRVVAEVQDTNSRLSLLLHVGDRPCIGHCFSYGNYEPATGQFRIRVTGPNPVVASTMEIVQEIEQDRYVVTAAEAPIYAVCQCKVDELTLCLRRVDAGGTTCVASLPVAPTLRLNPGETDAATGKQSEPDSKSPTPHTNN